MDNDTETNDDAVDFGDFSPDCVAGEHRDPEAFADRPPLAHKLGEGPTMHTTGAGRKVAHTQKP